MKQPNILFTAVKALIVSSDGKVLVLRQSDPTITGAGRCHPPGGIIELGESIHDCIVREVEEEIGVTPTVGKLFDVAEWRAERDEQIMQFIGLFYICEIPDTDLTLQLDEASEYLWVDEENIDSVDIMEPSKSIITRLLKG